MFSLVMKGIFRCEDLLVIQNPGEKESVAAAFVQWHEELVKDNALYQRP